jgi:ABC-type sugar transport system permease subunit
MRNQPNKPSFLSRIPTLLVMGIFLTAVFWLFVQLWGDGLYPLASGVAAVAIFLALVYLHPRLSAMRWLGVGLGLAMLFTLYPILFTFYLSVTNMGSGHLMSKQQAINRLESEQYQATDAPTYAWTAFRSPEDEFALWLIPATAGEASLLAKSGVPLQEATPGKDGVGELDDSGIPISLEGYEHLDRRAAVPIISTLGNIDFGEAPHTVRIVSISAAAASQPLYLYDRKLDAIIDQETGDVYRPIQGTFTSESGVELAPGYIEFISLQHFREFLGNRGFLDPLASIVGWNFAFAFLSVFISFAVGILITLLFENLPGRSIIRALLIIPWPIPVLISVLIWRSMLNPDLGFVAPMLKSIFGSSPEWFQDANWTRVALVLVNVWLSFPYFFVITSGAIRSIPSEIFDAAIVDGARAWNRFYYITLPLLLRIVAPLLIASFTFNFNNFNVIYLFNFGLPAMAKSAVPMGQTDILISVIYQLAFTVSNVANYGLAAAITVVLFVFIVAMVLLQARYTSLFEKGD